MFGKDFRIREFDTSRGLGIDIVLDVIHYLSGMNVLKDINVRRVGGGNRYGNDQQGLQSGT